MPEEFAVIGPEDEILEHLKSRSTGLLDRLTFCHGYRPSERDPFGDRSSGRCTPKLKSRHCLSGVDAREIMRPGA